MIGIRQKLLLGFGGLLVIAAILGLVSIRQFHALGQAIDVIMRENYQSVIACQNMKESLERIDSGILFSLLGYDQEGQRYIEVSLKRFSAARDLELHNITLPGEQEKAMRIQELFTRYQNALASVTDKTRPLDLRRVEYFATLLPLFQEIKNLAQEILEMNQNNMHVANIAARRQAEAARQKMFLFLGGCAVIAVIFAISINRWILQPIQQLIAMTHEIRQGNLDLVITSHSRDEIGKLSEAFNAMTQSLRMTRRQERIELARSRHAIEEVFKALPVPIAIVDLDGMIEVASETAIAWFGLTPRTRIADLPHQWLHRLFVQVLQENRVVEYRNNGGYLQQFVDNHEYFFQPLALPIHSKDDEQTGAVIVLNDMTEARQQKELKRSVISTVSHQLKTPLTSIRMGIYLLLEERVGPLTEKQAELLLAARDDSERLVGILDDLLDINRIESGKALMDLQPLPPHTIAWEGGMLYELEAKDKGICLEIAVPESLPNVLADSMRIKHVFGNLLSNALRFTNPGGKISITAEALPDVVRFSVTDTGKGIPPEYLHRVFEKFFRAPDQGDHTGAGLGLAIVQEIILAHGGQTGVESQVGKGSTFWFTLRRSDSSVLNAAP